MDSMSTEAWVLSTAMPLNDTIESSDEERSANVRVADTYTKPLYIAISLLGILSNAFTVIVILSSKQMRQKLTNVFILHQSIVDFVVAFFLLLTLVTAGQAYNFEGVQGELLCRLWLTSLPLWSSVLTSTYNLVALTLERYLEICHPIKHKVSFTLNKAAIVIAIIWMLGLLHQLPTHISTAGVVDGKCYVLKFWASKAANKVFGVFNFLVRYLIPLIIMIVAYTAMIRVLRGGLISPSSPQTAKPTRHQERMARARTNIFKTLLVVTIAFIVCWTLNQFLFLMFTFGFPLDFSTWWYNLSVILVNANCCINPFIYAAKYEAFQKSVKVLLCRGGRSVHPLDGSSIQTQSSRVHPVLKTEQPNHPSSVQRVPQDNEQIQAVSNAAETEEHMSSARGTPQDSTHM